MSSSSEQHAARRARIVSDPFRSDGAAVGGRLGDGRRCPECSRLLVQTLVCDSPPWCQCGWKDSKPEPELGGPAPNRKADPCSPHTDTPCS